MLGEEEVAAVLKSAPMCTALARRSFLCLARQSACLSATTLAPRPWPDLFLPTGLESTNYSLKWSPYFQFENHFPQIWRRRRQSVCEQLQDRHPPAVGRRDLTPLPPCSCSPTAKPRQPQSTPAASSGGLERPYCHK